MSNTGLLAAEGLPPGAAAVEIPGVLAAWEHPWDDVGRALGGVGFAEVDLPAPVIDHAGPGIVESAEVVTNPAPPYRLGGVAVEAAGVIPATALPGEQATRTRYQQFLGGVAMHLSRVGHPGAPTPVHSSSRDILRRAATDHKSRRALRQENRTHLAEIFGGVGESVSAEYEIGPDGRIMWAGQDTKARQFNLLTSFTDRSAAMRATDHADGLSSFRLEDRLRDGQLEGKTVFDLSAMAQAHQAELSEAGYFLNSIACCIRSWRFGRGTAHLNSIFVAGVDQRKVPIAPRETEAQEVTRQERALQLRFDIKVLRKIYGVFGVAGAEQLTSDEMLAIQLVADETFDNVDMTMLYDTLAAEDMEPGVKTFFGSVELWRQIGSPQELKREHYEAHIAGREARQRRQEALVDKITDVQIRRSGEARTPREAVALKRRVVLDVAVEAAIEHRDLDETRLGALAGEKIVAARVAAANGDMVARNRFKREAQDEAQDSSCPIKDREKNVFTPEGTPEDGRDRDDQCNEVCDGDRVNCPYCGLKVSAIVPERGGRIYCSNKRCDAAPTSPNSDSGDKAANKPSANLFNKPKASNQKKIAAPAKSVTPASAPKT